LQAAAAVLRVQGLKGQKVRTPQSCHTVGPEATEAEAQRRLEALGVSRVVGVEAVVAWLEVLVEPVETAAWW
jgi:hypothetical protein